MVVWGNLMKPPNGLGGPIKLGLKLNEDVSILKRLKKKYRARKKQV